MYHSGAWRGYWERTGFGKQSMGELELHFADGNIVGAGVDIVGRFDFQGQYNDKGQLRLLKQYRGKHQALYEGTYDGEGMIHGTWTIPYFDSGTFALTPHHELTSERRAYSID